MPVEERSAPLGDTNSGAGLIDAVGCGIWLYDGESILYVNEAMVRISGYTREELLSPRFFEHLIHPDDGDMIVARGQARVRGEQVPEDYDASLVASDGRRVWLHIHASTVEYKGKPCSLVSALDISERREAERAIQFIADVSAELGTSLDYAETLSSITNLSVPYLGDYAVMDIVDDFGRLRRIAGVHHDPHLSQRMNANMPDSDRFGPAHPIRQVVSTGRSVAVEGDVPAQVAIDDAHLSILRELGPETYVVVPLQGSRGVILGSMAFGLRRRLPSWHLELLRTTAEEVGRRAAHAIEQARLYERANKAAEDAAFNWHILDAMFAAAPIAMVFLDCDRRIVNINHVAARKSVSIADHVGRHPQDVMPIHWELVGPYYEQVLTTRQPILDVEHSQTHPKTGRVTTWVSSYYPVLGNGDRLLGVAGVGVDITERKAAEDELRRANSAKDELLGLVSHELRTPLTYVLGNALALRKHHTTISKEERGAAIDDIALAAERLQRLIENMLVLSRVEARTEVETEPVLLQRAVQSLVADHHVRFARARVALALEPDVPPVLAQPTYLEQIVQNLLSNAEKYAPAESVIDVVGRWDETSVSIGVLDRGPGIPQDEVDAVFVPFFRSQKTAAGQPGAGLGLAVCRRLADVQGGRVWAKPRDGGGTEMWLALPRADCPPAGLLAGRHAE